MRPADAEQVYPVVIISIHASSDDAATSVRQVIEDLLADVILPRDVQVIPITGRGVTPSATTAIIPDRVIIDVISSSDELSDVLGRVIKGLSVASATSDLLTITVTYYVIPNLCSYARDDGHGDDDAQDRARHYAEAERAIARARAPTPKLKLIP